MRGEKGQVPSMTSFLGRCLEVMTLREEDTFLICIIGLLGS